MFVRVVSGSSREVSGSDKQGGRIIAYCFGILTSQSKTSDFRFSFFVCSLYDVCEVNDMSTSKKEVMELTICQHKKKGK